jgi:hypothetical protein
VADSCPKEEFIFAVLNDCYHSPQGLRNPAPMMSDFRSEAVIRLNLV